MMSHTLRIFFPHDHKKEHVKSLDGLRGMAVLLVLLSHSGKAYIFIHPLINFQLAGKLGVYLFFVLSAYLLDRQITLTLLAGKNSRFYWKNYCLRRFLRIYPLFIISLSLYFLAFILGFSQINIHSTTYVFRHLLLLEGENIFWSIPVEFRYYLFSPLLLLFCHSILKWDKKYLVILFSFLIATSIYINFIFDLPRISTLRYLPIFITGSAIAILEIFWKDFSNTSLSKILLDFGAILALAAIFLTIPFYYQYFFGGKHNFYNVHTFFPFALLWGTVLLALKFGYGMVMRIFEFLPLRFIGVISFSMYLFHMLILEFIKNEQIISIPKPYKAFAFFTMTILVSSLSYLLIEKPLSKIKLKQPSIQAQPIGS